MPKLNYTHTRLLVDNFAECFKFYKDILGFQPILGSEKDVYSEFKTDGCIIALFQKSLMSSVVKTTKLPAQSKAQDSVLLIFGVSNVDATYQELKKKGVKFITEPHDQPDWMIRVAHFRDPNGTLIEINEPFKK